MLDLFGKSIVIRKSTITPAFRDELLDFFNRETRPITIALAANVTTLSEKKTEPVFFTHPYNLADEISGKIGSDKVAAASISFNDDTHVLTVCLGNEAEVQRFLNSKEYLRPHA